MMLPKTNSLWRLRLPGLSFVLYPSAFILVLLAGCGGGDPFSYVQVSGKVTYEDGSLIPYGLTLTFYPQCGPLDAKTYPRAGTAEVDKATGEFSSATTYQLNDGLVRGRHKVTIISIGGMIPPQIIPEEYSDLTRTPLEVDTAEQPFHLKVRKP